MWKATTETYLTEPPTTQRVYTNSVTGSKCTQTEVHTDKEGNKWYSFDDLSAIPYTRNFAATKISSLYALGLSKDDLNAHITGLKKILKSADPDKYEKAYASVLDFESKAASATDAIKQMSALVCVYFTMNDEGIDSFDGNLQIKKMAILEADPEMHNFFLSRQIDLIERYTTRLNQISQIVSLTSPAPPDHSE